MSYHLAVIAFIALCVLGMGEHYLWTGTLHTTAIGNTMNDQVGYVTTARNLADYGRLESSLYYPALLKYYKSHNLLYMPGIYYIYAFFFRVLGFSIFAAFLPNLLAFIGSSLLLFMIARHSFNVQTAYMSTISFMLFPPVILYAYSAMMEMLFVFFCLAAFYVFLRIPKKVRFILGGLPFVAPYLIRESAVLMLPGLAMMIYLDSDERKIQKSVLFTFLSLCVFLLIDRIPYVADIPPHFTLSLVNISALYTDATAVKDIHLSFFATLVVMLGNAVENIGAFKALLLDWKDWPAGFTFYLMALILGFICTIIILYNKKIKKAFGYFTISTLLILVAITFSILMYFRNSGIRQMLFMVPFLLCIAFYALSTSEISRRRGLTFFLQAVIIASCIFFCFISLGNFRRDVVKTSAYEQKSNNFLDASGVSNARFFVAPHQISLDYVNSHFPIRWSFIPDNEETLGLLSAKYHIDMLIIPLGHPLTVDMKERKVKDSLLNGAFKATESRVFDNALYLIYRPTGK